MDKYSYTVSWSPDDDAYVARVAEFRSLACHGDTAEAALRELQQVVQDTVDDLVANDEEVPEPLALQSYSGRMNVRMPSSLHQRLAITAAREGVSLNQLITTKLARD